MKPPISAAAAIRCPRAPAPHSRRVAHEHDKSWRQVRTAEAAARVCGTESAPRREGFRMIFRQGVAVAVGRFLLRRRGRWRRRAHAPGVHGAVHTMPPILGSNARENRRLEGPAKLALAGWHKPVGRCSVWAQTSVAVDDLIVPHANTEYLYISLFFFFSTGALTDMWSWQQGRRSRGGDIAVRRLRRGDKAKPCFLRPGAAVCL